MEDLCRTSELIAKGLSSASVFVLLYQHSKYFCTSTASTFVPVKQDLCRTSELIAKEHAARERGEHVQVYADICNEASMLLTQPLCY